MWTIYVICEWFMWVYDICLNSLNGIELQHFKGATGWYLLKSGDSVIMVVRTFNPFMSIGKNILSTSWNYKECVWTEQLMAVLTKYYHDVYLTKLCHFYDDGETRTVLICPGLWGGRKLKKSWNNKLAR